MLVCSRLRNPAVGALVALLLASRLSAIARADFALIDDFQSYAVASPIDGQGTWHAEAGANAVAAGVAADPLDAGNRVLNIGDGGFTGGRLGHRETINTAAALRVNQGETATLFFRLAWDTEQLDVSIGMSDVANPISDTIFNSFTQFESQLAFPFAPGADRVRVRDGGAFDTLTTDVAPLTWYSVWMVIDNAADTTEVFLQGGAFAAQTQLNSAGQTSFGFRNGTDTNDLLTLFIATGRNTDSTPPDPTENVGPLYVDDIYIDHGRNLANPVPEPSTLGLAAIGLTALLGWRRRARCRL